MPIYKYTALSTDGQGVRGETVDQSVAELRNRLEAQNLLVSSIRLKWWSLQSWQFRTLGLQEITLFVQELVVLLRAGLTLSEVLGVLTRRNTDTVLTGLLVQVHDAITKGESASQAFSKAGSVFDRLFIAALKTGEKTGDLVQPLTAYHRQLKQGLRLQKSVKQAMTYPAFLLLTLAVVMLLLFSFVLPRFSEVYADLGTELPSATAVLVAVSQWLPGLLIIIVVIAVTGMVWLRNPDRYRQARAIARFLLMKMPLVGSLLEQLYVYQFVSALSMLLKSGMPLLSSMELIQEDFADTPLFDDIKIISSAVSQGNPLVQVMTDSGRFHDSALKLIEVGEEVGSLAEMLNEAAIYYEEKIDTDVVRISAMIEPMLVLLMGLLVGGTIIVMYLPIFYMSSIV